MDLFPARVLRFLLPMVLAAALSAGCASNDNTRPEPGEIRERLSVFAATSLTETFTRLGEQFEEAHPGVDVVFNFGDSSTLAEQIRLGTPADVFASAATQPMERLAVSGGLATAPITFARNRLEIAVPAGNPEGLTGLADFGRSDLRTAVCAEETPCGSAARTVLQTAGITAKPAVTEPDGKAVLETVRLGEVDAGLVYRTDVRAEADAVEGIEFPEAARANNDYRIAPTAVAHDPDTAAAFVDFVTTPQAWSVFDAAGFDRP
ncbi:molybdate ABC transporter substrate-binding protein [Nocardia paucivorans]|uniref:molybdate ABC transporter substrate-binding protein n=1 Tax=Nocardia paucivorans TaxID=114259 RepID=UPI0009FFA8D0|nr:molybdate ABC transporter substrate-binding protein [Nocardia paucivorans]